MRVTVQFETQEEREALVAQYSHLVLVEENLLFTGKTLVFSDEPLLANKITLLEGAVDAIILGGV